MKTYLYVRASVMPADAGRVSLMNGLMEKATGLAVPDVIPHADPGSISFKHTIVVAPNEHAAYVAGYDKLPVPEDGAVCNDIVIEFNVTHNILDVEIGNWLKFGIGRRMMCSV